MGRVAVVTGGASGMGLAICRHLAERGDRVAVLDLDGDGAQRLAEELRTAGGQAIACAVDVVDPQAVDEALRTVRGELGPLEIMVTSAGITAVEPFADIALESLHRMIAVNLVGTFLCLQRAVPDMVATGWGRIVTISSASAQWGTAGQTHYSASKGGVISLTKSLAREYGPQGITVNTISPGWIDTPMARQAQADGFLPSAEVGATRMPVGRVGTPDDIAEACAYLSSEGAGFITGQVVAVNGGMVI
jgi:2-hydroxycyclohexanecarboxyl-CoA dehydrogenase